MQATQETVEQWRPVLGFEETHQVSNLGRIRRLATIVQTVRGPRPYRERILKITEHHYPHVVVKVNGKYHHLAVHVAVAGAFIDPRPEGMFVCHNNGDKTDNRVENIRYDTPQNNNYDKRLHGTDHYACRTHCKHGHEYTPQNTIRRQDAPGARVCRACRTANNLRMAEKRRQDKARARAQTAA